MFFLRHDAFFDWCVLYCMITTYRPKNKVVGIKPGNDVIWFKKLKSVFVVILTCIYLFILIYIKDLKACLDKVASYLIYGATECIWAQPDPGLATVPTEKCVLPPAAVPLLRLAVFVEDQVPSGFCCQVWSREKPPSPASMGGLDVSCVHILAEDTVQRVDEQQCDDRWHTHRPRLLSACWFPAVMEPMG